MQSTTRPTFEGLWAETGHSKTIVETTMGPSVWRELRLFFRDRLYDGMELQMSEVYESLSNVSGAVRGISGRLRGLTLDALLRDDPKTEALLARILSAARGLDTIDNLNIWRNFVIGVGVVARELEAKDDSYFDKNKPDGAAKFIEALVDLVEKLPHDIHDDAPGLMNHFATTVQYSSSLDSAFYHLEKVKSDLGISDSSA